MPTYNRTTVVDAGPTGDNVKQAVLDVDTDLTGAYTALNDIDGKIGVAGGIASLDGGGNIPTAQISMTSLADVAGAASGVATLNSYSKVVQDPASKGASNGVASLDSNGHHTVTEIPAVSWGHGEGRLVKSGSDLALNRIGLGRFVDGTGIMCQIPVTPITLSPSGSIAGTTYYIYLDMHVPASPALEYSTTVPVQASNGVMVKTGDTTRVLVGMARPITGPAWQDDPKQRYVISYFNRRNRQAITQFTANRSTTSGTIVEISSSERAEYLSWDDEPVGVSATLTAAVNTNTTANTAIGVDGTTVINGTFVNLGHVGGSLLLNYTCSVTYVDVSAGYHYSTILGNTGGGTFIVYGSATAGQGATIKTVIRG